jgi:hypothetical protein
LDRVLRIAGWGGAIVLLLLPLIAMQFTDEVNWMPGDFSAAALLLGATGVAMEAVFRKSTNWTYRIAGGIAAGSGLLLVWAVLAVGIIGAESDPVNLLFAAVLAVLAGGAVIVRLEADGMARTLIAAAVVHAIIMGIALAVGYGAETGYELIEVLGANGVFILAFLLSAGLFRIAAKAQNSAA